MTVISLREQVKSGTVAVRALRIRRLESGLPFMINIKEAGDQLCYIEYPNGNIHLVKQSSLGNDFETLEILEKSEAINLRRRFNLE